MQPIQLAKSRMKNNTKCRNSVMHTDVHDEFVYNCKNFKIT